MISPTPQTARRPQSKFKVRYTHPRWHVRFGTYRPDQPLQTFAIQELQRALQTFMPEVLDIAPANPDQTFAEAAQGGYLVIVGTPDDNPYVRQALDSLDTPLPDHDEGYLLSSLTAPWADNLRLFLIAGRTHRGVLYGVQDFNTTYLGAQTLWDDPLTPTLRDNLPTFTRAETPTVAQRGIWTWGYVIHDYRRFFDQMTRLRFNTITIWNDCPPINIHEVIDHAHARGIQVILGMPWGWGTTLDLTTPEDRAVLKASVLEEYAEKYAPLNHDGIYFQTLTETRDQMLGDQPRAQVICNVVNDIAGALFAQYPELANNLQLGLHATSILDHHPLLATLDPRLTITWEDAGVIPYSYDVSTIGDSPEGTVSGNALGTPEKTTAYSTQIAALRPHCPFAMVAKGFSKLRWSSEFENHGDFLLGERSEHFMRTRLSQTQTAWGRKNIEWATHYEKASHFYREVLAANPNNANVTALVEDGMFEMHIQPCVALFAQILWNPHADHLTMMRHMHSSYLAGNL